MAVLEHSPSSSRRASLCGATRTCIEIAGLRVAIDCSEPDMRFGANEIMRRFATACANADVNVRVSRGNREPLEGAKEIFDSGALWRLLFDGETYQFRFVSPLFGEQAYKVANFLAGLPLRSGVSESGLH